MGWSLLPDALRPFKIYCASPSIISQLVLILWQSVEIGPLGHVRIVEALQNFVQKCSCMVNARRSIAQPPESSHYHPISSVYDIILPNLSQIFAFLNHLISQSKSRSPVYSLPFLLSH